MSARPVLYVLMGRRGLLSEFRGDNPGWRLFTPDDRTAILYARVHDAQEARRNAIATFLTAGVELKVFEITAKFEILSEVISD